MLGCPENRGNFRATGKGVYEKTTTAQGTEHTYFIYAGSAHGGAAFSVRVLDELGSPKASRYFTFDHLGSTTTVTDESGRVSSDESVESGQLSYDVWGKRRLTDLHQVGEPVIGKTAGHREFTGQEAIAGLRLVNMNGRIYDPVIGRFLSPDPTTQSATDLQTYNRYAYARNNPLRYTDPTGYSVISTILQVAQVAVGVAGIATCGFTGGGGCVAGFAILSTALAVSSALVQGASLGQVFVVTAVSLGTSYLGGQFGGAVAEGLTTNGLARAVIGGALGAYFSAAGRASILGGPGDLGTSLGQAALMGAAWAAAGYAVQSGVVLSKAEAARAAGSPDEGTGQQAVQQHAEASTQSEGGSGEVAHNTPVTCGSEYRCGTVADETGEGLDLDDEARRFYRSRSRMGREDENIGDTTVRLKREHLTTILEGPDGSMRQDRVTIGGRGQETVEFSWRVRRGESVAAFAHGHFAINGSEHLSDVDISLGLKNNARVYMLPPGSKYIEVFEPARSWQQLPDGVKGTIYTIPGL